MQNWPAYKFNGVCKGCKELDLSICFLIVPDTRIIVGAGPLYRSTSSAAPSVTNIPHRNAPYPLLHSRLYRTKGLTGPMTTISRILKNDLYIMVLSPYR